ncbi:hypothetical protein HDV00_011315 [Rhizophlyctis rosea]|nr:hypothetical protein HDV00_011315 [Rhizophlyctis rosea]
MATFITEGDEGTIENLRLIYGPTFNSNDDPVFPKFSPFYADKFVEMAKYYKFDGWFLNIEAHMRGEKDAFAMVDFLEYLTGKMHKELPGSLAFFDVTDGCFVNYTWKPDYPLKSALLAGDGRRHQVYTGIDVYGRNTFGGGGQNCHKALRVIKSANTSCAIFAPAWNYEHLGRGTFARNDRRFWVDQDVKVKVPLNDKGEKPSTAEDPNDLGVIRDFVPERPAPGKEEFYTDFDQGFGECYCIEGKTIYTSSWSAHSRQSIPPTYRLSSDYHPTLFNQSTGTFHRIRTPNPRLTVTSDVVNAEAWNGGSVFVASLKGRRAFDTGREGRAAQGVVVRMYKLGVEDAREKVVKVRYRVLDGVIGVGVWVKVSSGTAKEIVEFSEGKSEVVEDGGWRVMEMDLNGVLDGNKAEVITEMGVVLVEGGGGIVDGGEGRTIMVGGEDVHNDVGREFNGVQDGERELIGRVHLGEISISTRKKATKPLAFGPVKVWNVVSFPARRVPPAKGGAFVTFHWGSAEVKEGWIDRYEVFVDGVWKGFAFTSMLRVWVEGADGANVPVRVVAYDGLGTVVGEWEGSVRIARAGLKHRQGSWDFCE